MRLRHACQPSGSLAPLCPSTCRPPYRLCIPHPHSHCSSIRSQSTHFQNQQAQGLQDRNYEPTESPLKHARRYQLVNPVLRSQLRNALDNLAQDLLDMSQYLSKINGERQLLLDRRNNLAQILKRTSGKGQRQLLAEDFAKLSESIQNLDAKLIDAR